MQSELFAVAGATASIDGLRYQSEFLGVDEEASLLEIIGSLPLHADQYKEYAARRRIVSFGGSFDYDENILRPGAPLDARLVPLRDRVAAWLGVAPESLVHASIYKMTGAARWDWQHCVPPMKALRWSITFRSRRLGGTKQSVMH